MKTPGSRLTEFRKFLGLTQKDFGKKINTDQTNVSHWEKDRNKPEGDKIILIQKIFPNLNIDWLINGFGNMLNIESKPSISEIENEIVFIVGSGDFVEIIAGDTIIKISKKSIKQIYKSIQYLEQ